jgi:hypothetical protein
MIGVIWSDVKVDVVVGVEARDERVGNEYTRTSCAINSLPALASVILSALHPAVRSAIGGGDKRIADDDFDVDCECCVVC